MGKVFKPTYTKAGPDGARITVQVKDWYIEYWGADQETHREKVGPSKRAADSALAMAQEREARRKHGIPDVESDAGLRNLPLSSLVADYLGVLESRDTSAEYRDHVAKRLTKISETCKWVSWCDVTADSLSLFLGRLRDGKDDVGLSTLNGYLRNAKGFANWYAEKLGVVSPLKKLKPYPEQKDRRRSRRILDDAEFGRLLASAEAAPRRHNCLVNGRDRSALYRVAAYTGMRAGELAKMTPSRFRLDSVPPVVIISAADTKGKRETTQPIPGHVAEFLRVWMKGKKASALLWPGTWAKYKRQVVWLKADCRRAGLGDGVHFHGLKRKYITAVIRAGGGVDQIRELGRHKNVATTLGYYVGSDLPELGRLVDKLPKPG